MSRFNTNPRTSKPPITAAKQIDDEDGHQSDVDDDDDDDDDDDYDDDYDYDYDYDDDEKEQTARHRHLLRFRSALLRMEHGYMLESANVSRAFRCPNPNACFGGEARSALGIQTFKL